MNRRTFHTFAEEYAANKSEESDDPIYIATDSSLDEGAIIRTTAPYGSPLAGPVQYFVGMDSEEASYVLAALDHHLEVAESDDMDTDWDVSTIRMIRDRVARLPYFPYFDGKDQS